MGGGGFLQPQVGARVFLDVPKLRVDKFMRYICGVNRTKNKKGKPKTLLEYLYSLIHAEYKRIQKEWILIQCLRLHTTVYMQTDKILEA